LLYSLIFLYLLELVEIFDYDISNITVKSEEDEIEYIYLPYVDEDYHFMERRPVQNFIKDLVKKMSPHLKIRLICQQGVDAVQARTTFENIENVEVIQSDIIEIWLRDTMPTFAKDTKTGETIAIKTKFNFLGK